MLPDVIGQSRQILTGSVADYNDRITPHVIENLDSLEEFRKRHLAYQPSFNFTGRRMDAETQKIEGEFSNYKNFVKDTLDIENTPYIRMIAAITGIK